MVEVGWNFIGDLAQISPFRREETEAQRGGVTCSRPQNNVVVALELDLRGPDIQSTAHYFLFFKENFL